MFKKLQKTYSLHDFIDIVRYVTNDNSIHYYARDGYFLRSFDKEAYFTLNEITILLTKYYNVEIEEIYVFPDEWLVYIVQKKKPSKWKLNLW